MTAINLSEEGRYSPCFQSTRHGFKDQTSKAELVREMAIFLEINDARFKLQLFLFVGCFHLGCDCRRLSHVGAAHFWYVFSYTEPCPSKHTVRSVSGTFAKSNEILINFLHHPEWSKHSLFLCHILIYCMILYQYLTIYQNIQIRFNEK